LYDKRPLAPLRDRKGWRIDRGYIFIFEPTHPNAHKDGYVAEHTKVMAELLGRPLERFEEVHHKNGLRSDNRPENLELWARGMQPPGSRVSDLIDAAVRVLKLYRPELLATYTPESSEVKVEEPPNTNWSVYYQGESRLLDSPEDVCPGQARFEYPATSVPFSNFYSDAVGEQLRPLKSDSFPHIFALFCCPLACARGGSP
jgi:hypothetical protein